MPHDDIIDFCCASGACCNEAKRREKLAEMLTHNLANINPNEAAAVANFIHNEFTLLPKSLGFGAAFHKYGEMISAHGPYE